MSETSLRKSVIIQPSTEPAPLHVVESSPEDQAHHLRLTESQVKTKARFWSKWSEQPLLHGKEPSLALISQLTGSTSIQTWWSKPGFKEWFLNSNANSDRLEWLVHLALSSAQDILLSDDPRGAPARAQMIKLVLDLATRQANPGTGPAKAVKPTPAKAVESLSKEELLSIVANANQQPGE